MDWEQWLRAASARPSDSEDEKRNRTEQQIRDALADYEPLQGKEYSVYAKGSYANNTNVRLNYDVDIAVEYRGYFYSDLCFDLEGRPKEDVDVVSSDDPYTRAEFKADIKDALVQAFGSKAISTGRIAYRVREKSTTLPADVVPSWEYRRYDRIVNGTPVFQEGSCVFPKGGSRTVNYPEQQRRNGNTKNNTTSKRYKRMVRALKKLQSRLEESGDITAPMPSYAVECLVYNVPDRHFGNDAYKSDMRGVLASIFNATMDGGDWNDWVEVNELKYLFRGETSWNRKQAHRLADAAWNELGFD